MQQKEESAERFNVLYSWEAIKPHIPGGIRISLINYQTPKNYKSINDLKRMYQLKIYKL